MDTLIHSRDRMRQIISFDGHDIGTITPTDIDFLIEYKKRFVIFGEYKHGDAPLPQGQALAFERICDAIEPTMPAYCFLAHHYVDDCSHDVNAWDALVSRIYRGGRGWTVLDDTRTVRDVVARILAKNST